jgi:NADH:ubiquinone oxidoreductase subunit D
LSGVLLRSIGFKIDLRVLDSTTYSFYRNINVLSYVSKNGDSLDRYNIRLFEVLESSSIINTLIFYNEYEYEPKTDQYMESTIKDFKIWSGVYNSCSGKKNAYIESPKGLFGTEILTDNSSIPITCKIRSPSYNHLYLLKYIIRGTQLADLITLIGTIDIVFGEIDR